MVVLLVGSDRFGYVFLNLDAVLRPNQVVLDKNFVPTEIGTKIVPDLLERVQEQLATFPLDDPVPRAKG